MRTLKDFASNYLTLVYGPAVSNRFSNSCAYVGRNELRRTLQGGLQFAILPAGVKVALPIKSRTAKLIHKRFKLKSGDYLHFDFLSKPDGYALKNKYYEIRKDEVKGAVNSQEFITFSIAYLSYILNYMKNGYQFYNQVRNAYEKGPPATPEELKAIKKEFRAIVKGKLVGILFDNNTNTYYKPEETLKNIRDTLGLFNKKPRLSININNTVHVRNNDYLTLQLYQY